MKTKIYIGARKDFIKNAAFFAVAAIIVSLSVIVIGFSVFAQSEYSEISVGPGGGGGLFNPKINPQNDSNFIMNTDMSGTFSSVDGGQSFVQKNVFGSANYAFNPHDKNIVYALNKQLYISYDSGQNFEMLYPKPSNIKEISSGIESGALYLYHDNAQAPTHSILDLAVDPVDPQLIYFISKGGWNGTRTVNAAIHKSTDGGQSFEIMSEFNSGMLGSINTNSTADYLRLAIDQSTPVNARSLDVLSSEGLFRISSDGTITTINTNTSVSGDIYYSQQSHRNFFYIVENAISDPVKDVGNITEHSWIEYFYESKGDLGWSGVGTGLTVSTGNPDTAIVSGFGNAYATTDGGLTWFDLTTKYDHTTKTAVSRGIEQTGTMTLQFDPKNASHMFMGVIDIGLFESFDSGKSWKRHQNNGIPSSAKFSNTAYGFVFDPDNPDFYLAAFSGVHDLNTEAFLKTAIHMYDHAQTNPNDQYSINSGGIVRSTDAGKTWTPSRTAMNGLILTHDDRLNGGTSGLPDHALVTDIVIDPKSPKNINERHVYVSCMGFGVYKSTDGGQTFERFIDGTEDAKRQTPWRLEWNRDYSRLYVIYAPTGSVKSDPDLIAWSPDDGPVYFLDRGANSWQRIASMPSENMPNNSSGHSYVAAFNGISLDSKNNLYAGGRVTSVSGSNTERNYGGGWLSSDNGANWTKIFPSTKNVQDVHVDSRNDNVVYLTSNDGGTVYVSYKGVDTIEGDWIALEGFENMNPSRIFEDPVSINHVYVSTFGGGVWHLELPYPVVEDAEKPDPEEKPEPGQSDNSIAPSTPSSGGEPQNSVLPDGANPSAWGSLTILATAGILFFACYLRKRKKTITFDKK